MGAPSVGSGLPGRAWSPYRSPLHNPYARKAHPNDLLTRLALTLGSATARRINAGRRSDMDDLAMAMLLLAFTLATLGLVEILGRLSGKGER